MRHFPQKPLFGDGLSFFVSKQFPGLKSRWTTDTRRAAASASVICRSRGSASALALQSCRQGFALVQGRITGCAGEGFQRHTLARRPILHREHLAHASTAQELFDCSRATPGPLHAIDIGEPGITW